MASRPPRLTAHHMHPIRGALCTGIAYYAFTQDAPDGNFKDLRAAGKMSGKKRTSGAFIEACKDHRVWALSLIYGCCFGMELTIFLRHKIRKIRTV